jgi:hypothetical protein
LKENEFFFKIGHTLMSTYSATQILNVFLLICENIHSLVVIWIINLNSLVVWSSQSEMGQDRFPPGIKLVVIHKK